MKASKADQEDDYYDEDAVLDPREKARRDRERELESDLNNAADLFGAAGLGGIIFLLHVNIFLSSCVFPRDFRQGA